MDYSNLMVSCTSDNTCGRAKENRYNPLTFVSPLMENCKDHFRFLTDGRIEGVTNEGADTIEYLNLNAYYLVQARKQQYKNCCDMPQYMGKDFVFEEYVQVKDGRLPRFVHQARRF